MPKTSAKRPIAPAPAPRRVRGDDCPMCSRAMHVDDEVITCSECGGEGCTEYCIPGGRGTACTDCTDGSNHGGSDDDA